MLVAIERNKFTYLYKYNEVRVDINQIIDKPIVTLKEMLRNDFEGLVQLLNVAVPLFEQDHEVIFLEIDKSKIKLKNGLLISFGSIHCIYPLTKIGSQLLEGKINVDFIVEEPVFENGIEALRILRSMKVRSNTSKKILAHFKLEEILNRKMTLAVASSVKKNLLDKTHPQEFDTFLDHLIAYNKTPSYIPDGNIEHICKIGAIAIKYMDKPEAVFTNGPFYNSCIKYKSKVNGNSYLESYRVFLSIFDNELKPSLEKMVEIISKDYKNIDIFKVSYFFLAFKSFINKHDNNIELLRSEIEALINDDRITATLVLSLIGYAFSFETIYEGMHRLSHSPLLKSTQTQKVAELKKEKSVSTEMARQQEAKAIVIESEVIGEQKVVKDVKEKFKPLIDNADETVTESIVLSQSEEVSEQIEVPYNQEPSKSPNDIETKNEEISKPIVIFDSYEGSVMSKDAESSKEESYEDDSILGNQEPSKSLNDLETKNEEISKPNAISDTDRDLEMTNDAESKNTYQNEIKVDIDKTTQVQVLNTQASTNPLTVQVFRAYLNNELSKQKQKQKAWFELLDVTYPIELEEISLETLLYKLDSNPDAKKKLLKTKKDNELLKAFFDSDK